MNSAEEQIKQMGSMFPSIYTLFAEKGIGLVPEPLSTEEQAHVKKVIHVTGERRLVVKECYHNSQLMALNDFDGRLKYWEGYALSDHCVIAVAHAWNTLNGKVVDTTARALAKKWPERKGEKWEYFGVEIDLNTLRTALLETRIHCCVTERPKYVEKVFGKQAFDRHVQRAKEYTVSKLK